MKAASLLAFFVAPALMTLGSFAQDIQSQISSQQRRIYRGYTYCDLSAGEAKSLQRDLDRIREDYEAMRADGALEPEEREALGSKLDRNRARLYWDMQNQERCIYR